MSSRAKENLWFSCLKPNPGASLRLFCFPYAGGSATIFRDWPQRIVGAAELYAVNLPGRGGRRSELPFSRLEPLVDAVAEAMTTMLDKPFVFFGHSMGALISFQVARWLRRGCGRLPLHLFLSSKSAPHLPDLLAPIHALPDAEFIEELRCLNGTPAKILQEREILQLMIPALRADFAVCETYRYHAEDALDCPITICGGVHDRWVSQDALKAWQIHTTAGFRLLMFHGDHFFLNTMRDSLLERVNEVILHNNQLLKSAAPRQ